VSNPFDQNIFTPAVAIAFQEAVLTDIYRQATPIPGFEVLKPWQDVDTNADVTVYPKVTQR
jgi:hypothetical protein